MIPLAHRDFKNTDGEGLCECDHAPRRFHFQGKRRCFFRALPERTRGNDHHGRTIRAVPEGFAGTKREVIDHFKRPGHIAALGECFDVRLVSFDGIELTSGFKGPVIVDFIFDLPSQGAGFFVVQATRPGRKIFVYRANGAFSTGLFPGFVILSFLFHLLALCCVLCIPELNHQDPGLSFMLA